MFLTFLVPTVYKQNKFKRKQNNIFNFLIAFKVFFLTKKVKMSNGYFCLLILSDYWSIAFVLHLSPPFSSVSAPYLFTILIVTISTNCIRFLHIIYKHTYVHMYVHYFVEYRIDRNFGGIRFEIVNNDCVRV